MRKVLTIAGSDSSGGAGIQADIKTIAAHGMYAMSAITALTAQNTTGVYAILDVPPEFAAAQIDSVFSDIVPDSVKIGMVSSAPLIDAIARKLAEHRARRVVLDPVMVATSGAKLLSDDALDALRARLMPLADVITPNVPEAEILSGMEITDARSMEDAGRAIAEACGCAVLIKGGHSCEDANDLLISGGRQTWFNGRRIDNPNTHGTGCTLSSAIACGLADDLTLEESVRRAKDFVSGALSSMLDLGRGSGPLDHGWMTRGR